MRSRALLPQLAILAYCAWQSDLQRHWLNPHAYTSGMVTAFVLWTLPVILMAYRRGAFDGMTTVSLAGLILATVGQLGSLNILGHLGFALAVVGLQNSLTVAVSMLVSFPAWTTAFNWLLGPSLGPTLPFARVLLAVFPIIVWWALVRNRRAGAEA